MGGGDAGLWPRLHDPGSAYGDAAIARDGEQFIAADLGVPYALGSVQFITLDQAGAVAAHLIKAVVADQAMAVPGDLFAPVVADLGVAVVEDQLLDITLRAQVDFSCPARSSIDSSL